ncbi:MAG: hypothetical protein R3E10_16050 [Gemmatimonadota bacterium]
MTRIAQSALIAATLLASSACSEADSQPAALDMEALVASAPDWTPAGLTEGLGLEPELQARINAEMERLHTSLLELAERHEVAASLQGEEQARYLADLHDSLQSLHQEHYGVWNSLPEDARQAIAERLHARMEEHHAQMGVSSREAGGLHERLKALHGSH